MKKYIIIGGKGTAVVIAEQIQDAQERFDAPVEFLGYAFDDLTNGDMINGKPILCPTRDVFAEYGAMNDVGFIFSLYRTDKMKERVALRESYNIPSNRYFTFVHPSCYVAKSAKLGNGVVLCANTVVNSGVVIGDYSLINSACLIGHDVKMGESCFLGAHTVLGSDLEIQEAVTFGLNCTVRNYLSIGSYSVIGMASNVTRDVPAGELVLGNPARSKEKLNNPY